MQTVENLSALWQRYFLQPLQGAGLDTWTVAFMAGDGQGLLLSLADPLHEVSVDVFVTEVSDADLAVFIEQYRQRFWEQLPARFGFFRPEVSRVLTEYPDWQTFYTAWLNDDAALLQANLPLLFDYPDALQYRAMQLKQGDYAGYRRLLLVLYQYRRRQFQKVFIKAVDDRLYSQIYTQMKQLYGQALPGLFAPSAEARHA